MSEPRYEGVRCAPWEFEVVLRISDEQLRMVLEGIEGDPFNGSVESHTNPPHWEPATNLEHLGWVWGYGFERTGSFLRFRSLYGDWTWEEDDRRVMEALAPFVVGEGHVVFERLDYPFDGDRKIEPEYGAWVFRRGGVELREAHKRVEWDIDR